MDDDEELLRRLTLHSALASAERVDMPELFYSEETDRPFVECIDCGTNLAQPAADPPLIDAEEPGDSDDGLVFYMEPFYHVHKTIVRGESVFEFAMCLDCTFQMESRFSQETREAIQKFCAENLALREGGRPETLDDWLAACMICGRLREECHRYSIGGFGVLSQLLVGSGPFVMCDECESRMGELISEKTRKEWDRFVEDHFDSPPGVGEDLPSSFPVLV